MRPTFSIIFFTVLSGAGYGLLFLVGIELVCGWSPAAQIAYAFEDFNSGAPAIRQWIADPRIAFGIMLATGTALATVGLLASVAHLGKPLRAWRAFSQWRSSWLSREGVISLLTYAPIVAIAAAMLAGGSLADSGGVLRVSGALLALGCAATVFCTGNIYSSLKPIRAWHNAYVVPGYLLLGLYCGLLCFLALDRLSVADFEAGPAASLALMVSTLVIAPLCAGLKWKYWRSLDALPPLPNAGAATGLDRLGTVRSFEQPHTEENYLTHEMGFVLARVHARRLRASAFWLILLAPFVTLAFGWLAGPVSAWIALILGMLGVFVERWLFFAEARHAVIGFYGR